MLTVPDDKQAHQIKCNYKLWHKFLGSIVCLTLAVAYKSRYTLKKTKVS